MARFRKTHNNKQQIMDFNFKICNRFSCKILKMILVSLLKITCKTCVFLLSFAILVKDSIIRLSQKIIIKILIAKIIH